jgi:hypothetical protein
MKRAIMLTETDIHNIIRGVLIEAYSGLIDNGQNQDELHRAACQKGFNLIGYHNTRERFLTNFYNRSAGIHFGSLKAANDRGEQNEHGYDCIIYRNEREDVGNYSIAMFNPNHIKLARQTYDDNNRPIPLEKRFNTNTDDVRY